MHLLKCQIVSILHSSSIVLKGYHKLSENYKEQLEGKIVEYDEEYKPLFFEEMKDPEFVIGLMNMHMYTLMKKL